MKLDKIEMGTVVITPSYVPGRVSIRIYKDGQFKMFRLSDGTCDGICKHLHSLLHEMGLDKE